MSNLLNDSHLNCGRTGFSVLSCSKSSALALWLPSLPEDPKMEDVSKLLYGRMLSNMYIKNAIEINIRGLKISYQLLVF